MRHTVLVVDDEASIADGLRLTLEAEGYSVRIAGSVRTGLAAGMVVARDGDFYGPVVNLASRLTEVVPPGEIYASEALHDQLAADPSFDWTAIGPLELRSIGPAQVFALNSSAGSIS